jgi:hypothetical protein
MKITFTGTQGTGKSTIQDLFLLDNRFKDHKIITSITRELNFQYKIPINLESNDETQLLIFNKYLEKFLLTLDFVSDRGLLDVLSYTRYFNYKKLVSDEIVEYQYDMYRKYNKSQGIIVYFPILFPVVTDKYRVADEEYRKSVDNYILEILNTFHGGNFITVEKGTPEERFNQIIKQIL